jgi:thymidylate synthase (FAD)
LTRVLDRGHVELVDRCGDDLSVINFARASFGKFQTEPQEGDAKLINFLMRNRHGSPFEAIDFTFHVKAPLCVVREWQRHRIASYNELSGRYVELEPEFYVPDLDAMRSQVGKPGAYVFRAMDDEAAMRMRIVMMEMCEKSFAAYKILLEAGVARELARNVLPLATYTQFFFKTNARSLMNFLSLRNANNAMHEIRLYAQAIEEFFEKSCPLTYEAFVKNGRIAP